MVASPPVGATRPSSIRGVVVLPAPLGPPKPVTRPGSTVKDRSLTAARSPYCSVSRETTTSPGSPAAAGASCDLRSSVRSTGRVRSCSLIAGTGPVAPLAPLQPCHQRDHGKQHQQGDGAITEAEPVPLTGPVGQRRAERAGEQVGAPEGGHAVEPTEPPQHPGDDDGHREQHGGGKQAQPQVEGGEVTQGGAQGEGAEHGGPVERLPP